MGEYRPRPGTYAEKAMKALSINPMDSFCLADEMGVPSKNLKNYLIQPIRRGAIVHAEGHWRLAGG